MRTWKHIRQQGRMAAALLAAVLAGGCASAPAEIPQLIEPVSPGIQTAEAGRQTVYEMKYYESYVLPRLTELSFSENGTVEELSAYIGKEVKEGDVLATLSGAAKEYERLTEQYSAQKEGNAYDNELFELQIAHAELENGLYQTGNDTERMKLLLSQQKELQKLDEEYTKDCLDKMEAHLADAYLVAPEDGVVAAMANLWKGSYVTEDTPILTLADDGEQYVMCEYISQLAIDRSDRVYAMIADREYELEYLPIDQTELSAIRMKEEKAYSTFRVLGGDESLVGRYAVICVVRNTREDVTAVPLTALFSDGDGDYVYCMNGGGRRRVNVSVGVKGVHYAEITDGISEGDIVYVQESAIPNYSATVTLEYQDFTVNASTGISVYYPQQSMSVYQGGYGPAVFGEWLVVKGDEVKRGDPIMNIRIPVDEISVMELELGMERLKKEKDALEADAKAQIRDKKEKIAAASGAYKELLQNELAQAELESGKRLQQAEENIRRAEEQLAAAYEARETTQLLATCDGTVFYMEPMRKDDLIYPGATVCLMYDKEEALYNFTDKTKVLRYGQSLTVYDMKNNEFSGVIVSAAHQAMDAGLLRAETYLRCLSDIEEAKRYGLEISYKVIDLEHVLVVPAEAVHSDTFGTYVVEVLADGTRRRYFSAGKTMGGNCFVVDGLEAGITLVVE